MFINVLHGFYMVLPLSGGSKASSPAFRRSGLCWRPALCAHEREEQEAPGEEIGRQDLDAQHPNERVELEEILPLAPLSRGPSTADLMMLHRISEGAVLSRAEESDVGLRCGFFSSGFPWISVGFLQEGVSRRGLELVDREAARASSAR